MKPVITPDESARLDAAATEPVEVLMERAGLGVALAAARMGARYGTRVLALAGPGNNGGDAYVAARHLRRRGVAVEVRALGYPKGADSPARKAAAAAVAAGVPVRPLGDPEPCDLLIDGLFGAGFRGRDARASPPPGPPIPPRSWRSTCPAASNGADGSVAGPAFTARRTVTFHALKVGHLFGEGPDRCGEVEVVDIGLTGGDPELRLCEEADAPVPARAAHRPQVVGGGGAGGGRVAGHLGRCRPGRARRPPLRRRVRAPRLPRRPAAHAGRRRPVAHHRRHRHAGSASAPPRLPRCSPPASAST